MVQSKLKGRRVMVRGVTDTLQHRFRACSLAGDLGDACCNTYDLRRCLAEDSSRCFCKAHHLLSYMQHVIMWGPKVAFCFACPNHQPVMTLSRTFLPTTHKHTYREVILLLRSFLYALKWSNAIYMPIALKNNKRFPLQRFGKFCAMVRKS